MGFETGSDNERIEELERQLDDIIDSQLNSIGGNESLSIDSTLGQRNAASGDAGGVRSNQPIIHNITDIDEGGTPTGVFDKINLISSMIIVDHTSTPIDLRFIQGPAKDGAKIKITVKKDKTLVIKSGGNILTSSDITISDTEFFILVKYSQAETGVTGGAYKILLTGTGGGGVSFPIDFPITFLGTIGSITQIIDFSLSTRHGWKAEFNGDVELAFDNPPTGEQGFATFKFKQDGTGGHTLTLPVGTINKATVEAGFLLGANDETGIVIQFFNDTFYAFLETGNIVSGGGGGSGDVVGPASSTDEAIARFDGVTGKLIQNSTVFISDLGALSGVTGIDLDGATATIVGAQLIDLFQADQKIESLSTGIEYSAGDLQSHLFKSQTIDIAKFEESAANVFRLDMLDHAIKDVRDVTFSNASGAVIFPGSSPAIGFDSVAASLVINFPAGAKIAISENNVIGSTEIRLDEVTANLLTANASLLIGLLGGAPTVSGQFTNDGTDTFVFSGAAVRNMSNIGVAAGGADVFLSNLSSPTDINQDLLPQAGKTLGDTGNLWSSIHVNNLRLGTAGVVSATSNQILGTSSGIDFNVPSTFNFDFLVNGINIGSISSSGILNFAGAIIDDVISLKDTVSFPGLNGDIYREGADVKIVSGGIERNISDVGGAGLQTPWIQDIDADGFDLKDLSNIEFRTTTGAPAIGIDAIFTTSTDMIFNVASGKDFSWRIQGLDKLVLDDTFAAFDVAVVIDANLNVNDNVVLGSTSADLIFILGTLQSDIQMSNSVDFEFGTGTGTRIGTSTSQKLAFYNTTPVVQQSVASDTLPNLYTVLRAYGLVA